MGKDIRLSPKVPKKDKALKKPSVPKKTAKVPKKATTFSTTDGCYRSRIYTSQVNINPLVAACDQILSLATVLKNTERPENLDKLLQDLTHEIHSFEQQAKTANYPDNIILEARYALCHLLDETIATNDWCQKITSPKKMLLAKFYNESDGNKRFFSIIEDALKDIQANLHLIELMYLCLNIGFTSKPYTTKVGQNKLIATTNKLYQIITQHNHLNLKNILINESSDSQQKHPTLPPPPVTSTIIDTKKLFGLTIALAVITVTIFFFSINLKLNNFIKPIISTIEQPIKK